MIALALLTVFGAGWHILVMAFQSLRRGILDQHFAQSQPAENILDRAPLLHR